MIKLCSIDFDKTLKYFVKDKFEYQQNECHSNTYSRFYSCNCEEVDLRSNDFSFHTGLICYEDTKKCVIHSWVEDKNNIIDVTSISNSQIAFNKNITSNMIEDIRKILCDKIRYIEYYSISNVELTRLIRLFFMENNFNEKKAINELENHIMSIVKKIELDNEFLNKIKKEYGYDLMHDDYIVFIE